MQRRSQALYTALPSRESGVYTNDTKAYQALKKAAHAAVKHSVTHYEDGMAHINGMESFWSLLKRGYYGTYHKMSPERLQCYVDEFVGRQNIRHLDIDTPMEQIAKGFIRKVLTYKMLAGHRGNIAQK
ncbi:MAG: transposase [Rhodothermaceae bacterium]|nr:transposase [Acidimicrobiaceae bacterium]MYC03727.1 transposase [Rhodothermaceae bacterium]